MHRRYSANVGSSPARVSGHLNEAARIYGFSRRQRGCSVPCSSCTSMFVTRPFPQQCSLRRTSLMQTSLGKNRLRATPLAAMTRLATVDQLLRKAPVVLDATGTPDAFNNIGGAISWIKSLSASVSNGLRNILNVEGAASAASL